MADQLATPADLASLLQVDLAELNAASAAVALEAATAVVQAVAGQRLVQVTNDTATLMGTTSAWLDLPQRPVTAVTSVTINGDPVTEGTTTGNFRRFGARLWRDCGWAPRSTDTLDERNPWLPPREPATVVVVYTHGYATGAQELQLARSAVLSLARTAYANPSGVTREAVDDYSVQFEAASAAMDASPFLKSALRRQYGRRSGLVKVG